MSETYAAPCSHCGRLFTDVAAHLSRRCGVVRVLTEKVRAPVFTMERWLDSVFWAKIDRRGPDECWPWKAGTGNSGYGNVNVPKAFRARWGIPPGGAIGPHRLALTLAIGPLGPGVVVCHRCNTKRCCNPGHLYAGNPLENSRDYAAVRASQAPRAP